MALFMEGNQSALILYSQYSNAIHFKHNIALKTAGTVSGWNLVAKGERDDINLQSRFFMFYFMYYQSQFIMYLFNIFYI